MKPGDRTTEFWLTLRVATAALVRLLLANRTRYHTLVELLPVPWWWVMNAPEVRGETRFATLRQDQAAPGGIAN